MNVKNYTLQPSQIVAGMFFELGGPPSLEDAEKRAAAYLLAHPAVAIEWKRRLDEKFLEQARRDGLLFTDRPSS